MTFIPDSELHPAATGPAADLVARHKDPAPLVLYSGWFLQRVWAVLEEKNIPYQYVEVNPYHKPDSLLKLNPRGLVPTLEYDGKPLYESNIICEFIEDAYPSAQPRLLPSDPYLRARARIWIDFGTTRLIPSFFRFLQYQPDPVMPTSGSETALEKLRETFLGQLREFASEMTEEEPFFLGKELSMVDTAIAPWAGRLWVFDKYKGGLGIPKEGDGGEHDDTWARWRVWLQAVMERKSIKETFSEEKHYWPIYQRYADNTAQSEVAKATRGGKVLP
ncbi:MAG: hypothetical protein M1833_000221 [Piccolia ochrophora]|nr:MAG: hypothetical protein M1833_000221 [Piccolia ochrophora]